jgi:predicted ATPase
VRGWNRYLAESVLYLGPLRVGPRATYGLGASVENSNIPLGESGEFLAKRMFIDDTPKAYPIVENGKLKDARFTLEQAVTFWYNELTSNGEQNGINVDAPNRQGYPLKIGKRTLANVGFGASQILPVLGLCLSALPGDLVLLEQPELHLNPGMQQKLADFLLTMAKTGRQIIVETHSEYLITRLRRSAATDVDDHKYFTIIFVERDPLTGTSYRTVSVDDQGDLSEWPKGFFDHVAEDLRILMRKAAERQSAKARPGSTSIEE